MGNVKHIKTEDLNRIRDYFHWRNKIVILNLINIGVNVALRISDLQNLKFQDVNEDGTIRVKEKKTKKIRIIALNNVCIKSIKELQHTTFFIPFNCANKSFMNAIFAIHTFYAQYFII